MPDDARPKPEAQPDARRHDHAELSIRTIADRLNGRPNGDHADDARPSIAAIVASLGSRPEAERRALAHALLDGRNQVPPDFHGASSAQHDVMPVPGLEPAAIHKGGQDQPFDMDPAVSASLGPLPGTSFFQRAENAGESSARRSSERVCYTEQLHSRAAVRLKNPQKTVPQHLPDCYTNLLHNLPVGVSLRGRRFYYRRRLPSDVQRLTGKVEVWRSLGTDSLKAALRRLPNVASRTCKLHSRSGLAKALKRFTLPNDIIGALPHGRPARFCQFRRRS